MTIESKLNQEPVGIAEFITKNCRSRLPKMRIKALADVITHSDKGYLIPHGGFELEWENSQGTCELTLFN